MSLVWHIRHQYSCNTCWPSSDWLVAGSYRCMTIERLNGTWKLIFTVDCTKLFHLNEYLLKNKRNSIPVKHTFCGDSADVTACQQNEWLFPKVINYLPAKVRQGDQSCFPSSSSSSSLGDFVVLYNCTMFDYLNGSVVIFCDVSLH